MKKGRSWLVDARKAYGLTQSDLAARIGITRQQISFIELGGTPAVATAMKIAKELNLDWTDFFEGADAS